MRGRSDNIRTLPLEHAALWLAPGALAILALSAVVAPGLHHGPTREAERLELQRQLGECERLRSTLIEFAEAGGAERVAALEEAALAVTPRELAPFEVQAHVRLLAETLGLELESVDLGEPRQPVCSIAAGGVAERPLVVRGSGAPELLAVWVDGLRELGHSLAVNSFELTISAHGTPAARFRVELGLFQTAEDAAPTERGTEPGAEQR